jgi:outer membrane receptor protein involved in Fe transport
VTPVKITAGLRFDYLRYDYDDQLTGPDTARYQRPPSGAVSYEHLSPKLGVTWEVSPTVNVFGSYRHAFRAPSESQLFRQGPARDTIALEPVKADNTEAGVRLTLPARSSLEVSVYRLMKRDDVLSYRDPRDGATVVVNAGRTSHTGVEIGASTRPISTLQVAFAWSRALHEYDEWVVDPAQGVDYSGNEIEVAPRDIGSLVATWQPVPRVSVSAEATHIGRYWLDAANTTTYGGHTLLNLRGEVRIARQVHVFGRILNATDRLYAESGSFTLLRGREFAPGAPRTLYAGVKVEWPR